MEREKDKNVINLVEYKAQWRPKKDRDRLLAIKDIVYEIENNEIRRTCLVCLRDVWLIDLSS